MECRIDHHEVHDLALDLYSRVCADTSITVPRIMAYPIPRGGVPAAYAVVTCGNRIGITDNPAQADIFIDDIVDSGRTRQKWEQEYGRPVYALIDKVEIQSHKLNYDNWIVWPWEGSQEAGLEDNIVRLLEYIGEDPKREGLLETPKRVAKAWKHWASGYLVKPEDVLKSFEDGAQNVDEMVVVKDITFYSHCEHHLAPFFGTATIAYIPNGKIVGLSKLARLTDVFSRRLQVQERLTNQIAEALMEHLQPKGVGVVIKARHMCIESRGADKQNSVTVTSALRGVIKEKPEARAEFMAFMK